MDIKEFQKKLVQIVEMGKAGGNCISTSQVEELFREEELSGEQLEKVYEYLNIQKIQVTGRKAESNQPQQEDFDRVSYQTAPLSEEEKSYLKKYQETLKQISKSTEPIEGLIQRAQKGDADALQKAVEFYMPLVVDIAVELHHAQISLADTIAEGNVHLMMALNRVETTEHLDFRIKKGIRDGILYMIEEQTEQKRRDDTMVEKVTRLEKAVKDLTDGDDDLEFSVDELSIFLDMPKEEIEDVLRLVGETNHSCE